MTGSDGFGIVSAFSASASRTDGFESEDHKNRDFNSRRSIKITFEHVSKVVFFVVVVKVDHGRELPGAHDGDWGHVELPGHPVLDHIEHELVIEQSDQVKTAETGRAAEREVPRD